MITQVYVQEQSTCTIIYVRLTRRISFVPTCKFKSMDYNTGNWGYPSSSYNIYVTKFKFQLTNSHLLRAIDVQCYQYFEGIHFPLSFQADSQSVRRADLNMITDDAIMSIVTITKRIFYSDSVAFCNPMQIIHP